jgi:hypothetical protein
MSARDPLAWLHYELVLIDQSQLRQRLRELQAWHEQSLTRVLVELLNRRRANRPGAGFPIRRTSLPG